MIIGLLALYFIFFGGGHETFLLDPNFQKSANIYVKDKDRRSEIDKLVKEVAKSEENFQKEAKKTYDKKFEALNMDHASTPAEFKQQYLSLIHI